MKHFVTKKNITIISVIGAVILLVWDYIGNVHWCTWGEGLHRECLHFLANFEMILLPILPIALFSLLTYKMREEIFITWINFAKWWIPLTILFTLFAPGSDGSFLPVTKGSVSFVMSTLFAALSFCIIIAMWAQKEKK
ncbi:MAG: hypothetical protein A3A73_01810 [Omnitrophica bacterium RIFCSPLOWO2_01_FULL_50_24]|nr:MAG: hypothetical protein A3A73_01810 [Omnitrophica bacterium RIFCSPLOWO2_01_FULL_50_24]